jgi:hypothetical protein
MSGSHDHRAAVRKDADLMVRVLMSVSGMLEDATLWRRVEFSGQSSFSSPGDLQDAVRSLADAVRALPDADCEQHPALVISAVAQLAAIESDAALSAAVTGGSHLGDAEVWTAILGGLHRAGKQLWSLICNVVRTGDTSLTEDGAEGRDEPMVRGRPTRPGPPATAPEVAEALAMQRKALDVLPEAELRRLLALIGGMDPAALQRAAAAYTEIYCAVAEMEASVAALRPVARAVPGNDPHDHGRDV